MRALEYWSNRVRAHELFPDYGRYDALRYIERGGSTRPKLQQAKRERVPWVLSAGNAPSPFLQVLPLGIAGKLLSSALLGTQVSPERCIAGLHRGASSKVYVSATGLCSFTCFRELPGWHAKPTTLLYTQHSRNS